MKIKITEIKKPPIGYILGAFMMMLPVYSSGQAWEKTIPDGTEGETHPTVDSTNKKKKPFNSFDLGFTTFKVGVAFLYEYAGFSQDEIGKQQMDSAKTELESAFDVRDARLFLSGKINTKRLITWKVGIMYDGSLDAWFIRESGVMIAIPEIWGSVFIGRTKEGVSLSKVMSGYAVETMERHMASDPIPILADGVKWLGYLPKQRIFWNLGVYADWFSEGQSFSTYSSQFAARIGWLPIYSPATRTGLHVAANIRLGQPYKDSIMLRSRPESNPAPFFISTGKFKSDQSTYLGGEIYYSRGSWMMGTEYYWDRFNAPEKGDPVFHGGEVMVSYIFTGESRPYSTESGNIYGFVPVKRPVFKGGPGALEAVLRFSTFNLNDGPIKGGTFWKITPMVNWYLTEYLRFELGYGYGILDRYNLKGATHFLQSRLQFTLR